MKTKYYKAIAEAQTAAKLLSIRDAIFADNSLSNSAYLDLEEAVYNRAATLNVCLDDYTPSEAELAKLAELAERFS